MSPDAAGRETFTERARRQQLVTVTIDLVAEIGYARSSLQRIANAAGITKAAVLYHFPSKNALIRTAYDHVMTSMTDYVGRRIEAARTPADAVDAYVSALIGYLAQHPAHMRMIVESLDDHRTGIRDRADRPARWKPLADLISAAQTSGHLRTGLEPRTTAIILGGAIDGAIAEYLNDPTFDLQQATTTLLDLLHLGTRIR